MEHADFDPPLSAAIAMVGFERPWCIAGGWAIDLWLGRVTRQHKDVQIAILRDHQIELRDYCHGWQFRIRTMDKRLVPWKDTNRQMLMLPVHELHATDRAGRPFEFLLNESDGIDWIDRRNFDVRLKLSKWTIRAFKGVPVLCPAIVLLNKCAQPRDVDELDLRSSLDHLGEDERTWLKLAIMRCDPNHGWLDLL